jgi:hypothetical protein
MDIPPSAEASNAAAEFIAPYVTGLCREILVHLSCHRECGVTCAEAEFDLVMRHQTASARFCELKKDGLIEPCLRGDGKGYQKRKTEGQRVGSVVYFITTKGIQQLCR